MSFRGDAGGPGRDGEERRDRREREEAILRCIARAGDVHCAERLSSLNRRVEDDKKRVESRREHQPERRESALQSYKPRDGETRAPGRPGRLETVALIVVPSTIH